MYTIDSSSDKFFSSVRASSTSSGRGGFFPYGSVSVNADTSLGFPFLGWGVGAGPPAVLKSLLSIVFSREEGEAVSQPAVIRSLFTVPDGPFEIFQKGFFVYFPRVRLSVIVRSACVEDVPCEGLQL